MTSPLQARATWRGLFTALTAAGLMAAAGPELASGAPNAVSPAPAAKPAAEKSGAKQTPKSTDPALFPTKSKEPIYITADRLDIFDKEGRAVYSGPSGVVVTQGASKVVGTELTAYYERQHDQQQGAAGSSGGSQMSGSAIKRILVKGPVSVVQNDQVATGDDADFDRVQNIVTLTGHVSMTQGPNVTTGDKLIYNLNSGVANVYSAPGTPVKSLFVQGSQGPAAGAAGSGDKAATPDKPGKKPAPAASKQQ
jgi:lipopolysaccharide export system protein LptA